MRFSDEALILDRHAYRDRHLIVAALSCHHGVVRGVLRGARAGKAAQGAATQVLSLVKLDVYRGPNAELSSLRRVDLIRSSFPLAKDLDRAAAAAVVAEALITFCAPESRAEPVFRLGRSLLDGLLAQVNPVLAVTYCQYWILALSGVLPPLDCCGVCGAEISPPVQTRIADGQPLCQRCTSASAMRLDPESVRFLAACRRHPVATIGQQAVPTAAAAWLDRLIHSEADRPLKALDFFHRHRQP